MRHYNPSEIEPKWQQIWADDQRYHTNESSAKPKYYVTGMFPYPSGAGMHTGHFMEHSIVDAVARFRRALGYNVMYPIGWDSFGLPAENYAIKTGRKPRETTADNIANFKKQLRSVGASIDWSREINTSDPEYYKWTQWIFTKLFEKDLAYQKESLQWWCPKDKTVLANEQVIDGKCWRCDSVVVKKSMKQWFFRITAYAEQLLAELPEMDWPDKIKIAQTNWIGKSEGAEITFQVDGSDDTITVFSTRPDTIFGATFLVLAPEYSLARTLLNDETRELVEKYIDNAVKKSEIERSNDTKEKTGVFSGSYAINPATGQKIPIWIADYVLGGYGTGAVMGVPAHDDRDFAFAEKFELPVVEVIERPEDDIDTDVCYHGEGVLVNSGAFDGTRSEDAREQIVAWLEQEGKGKLQITYKMRDWLISRQRYWGAPIPIIYCPEHGAVPVPESDLPVLLPDVDDFQPRGDGKSVLAAQEDWVQTTCPVCGSPARRETDTMDGYACSSWYLLRYTDPHNAQQAWAPDKANYWAPLDMYVGGDHATAHLLYVRFWTHVFRELRLTDFAEPVKKLVYHGLIQAEDGRKMSKSLGNVVDPLEVINAGYGADALRTFELFLGPINENSSWNSRGIAGVYRFLNRLWTLVQEFDDSDKTDTSDTQKLDTIINSTTKKVTDDIHRLSFNTAIAALMECVNDLYKLKVAGYSEDWRPHLKTLVQLVQPFAPHMAAELWQQLGETSQLDFAAWPVWDNAKIASDSLLIIVQVNGKLRAKLEVAADASEEQIKDLALADANVQKFVPAEPKKIIYVKGKLINIVA
jgi:leucine--tRNA ligase